MQSNLRETPMLSRESSRIQLRSKENSASVVESPSKINSSHTLDKHLRFDSVSNTTNGEREEGKVAVEAHILDSESRYSYSCCSSSEEADSLVKASKGTATFKAMPHMLGPPNFVICTPSAAGGSTPSSQQMSTSNKRDKRLGVIRFR